MQPAAFAARERADDLLLIAALEVEAAEIGARRHLELADLQQVEAAADVVEHGLRRRRAIRGSDRRPRA